MPVAWLNKTNKMVHNWAEAHTLPTGSQGRIKGGQRGQLPRAPRGNGAPRDEIYLFQIKYSY